MGWGVQGGGGQVMEGQSSVACLSDRNCIDKTIRTSQTRIDLDQEVSETSCSLVAEQKFLIYNAAHPSASSQPAGLSAKCPAAPLKVDTVELHPWLALLGYRRLVRKCTKLHNGEATAPLS